MEAIGDDGSLDLGRTRPISEVANGYTYFREGDVAVAKLTPCFENGKGAVMRKLVGGVGFGTTELIVVRPRPLKTCSEYLHWLFVSHPFPKLGEASMYGAGGQKSVPDDFVRDFAIAFPPPPEQAAIAAFLDHETAKIDDLVAEQRNLIALLKEKRQTLISHAVTKGQDPHVPMQDSGVESLGEVPVHWEVGPLKRFADVIDCKHHTVQFLDEGWPIVSIRELRDDRIDLNAKLTSREEWDFLREGRVPRHGELLLLVPGRHDVAADRVAEVALKSGKQSDLDTALAPVAQRLLTRFKHALAKYREAEEGSKAAREAKDEMDALTLFKRDIGTYVRLYAFLSQIVDYGNTDIEKRAIFFRFLHKLLDFGREHEGVDLSSLALTHYTLKDLGTRKLALDSADGDYRIRPTSESGSVQDKDKAALDEIIARVNELFEGDLTPGDKLVYVDSAIKGKLLECETLIEQAVNNTKEQFASSPDLDARITDAVMDALASFTHMSKQALESAQIRAEIKSILLGPGRLYEGLRGRAASE